MKNERFTNLLQIASTVHLIQVLQGKTNCKGLTIAKGLTMLAKKKLKTTITGRFALGEASCLGASSEPAEGKNTC